MRPRGWAAVGQERRRIGRGASAVVLAGVVLAGGLLAVQARVNAALGARLGSAVVAALVSYGVASGTLLLVLASSRRGRRALRARPAGPVRWFWWLGGLAGAGVVVATTTSVPVVGVALVSVCLVAGATSGGLVVDWAGWGPAGSQRPTGTRLVGAGLAVGAVGVGALGHRGGHGHLGLLVLVVVAGVCSAGQQAATGQLAGVTGDARVASLVSCVVAAAGLIAAVGLLAAGGRLPRLHWPGVGGVYLGGVAVAAYGVVAAATVRRLGVLLLTVATVSGQLLTAVALDALAPPVGGLRATTVLGAGLTLVAVAVAAPHQARRRLSRPDTLGSNRPPVR